MALRASTPPSSLSSQSQDLSDKLDADIARIRSEIETLTKRKTLLKSSLLSSTKVQNHLAAHGIHGHTNTDVVQTNEPLDLSPLQAQAIHNQTNIHRLAYGVTSFPYTDPNPDISDRPLLGIRFDVPSRSGKFEKAPYYLFLKRTNDDRAGTDTMATSSRDKHLKIHHHTIPAFVPLGDYEARYLPRSIGHESSIEGQGSDEGYHSPSSANQGDGEDDVTMQDDGNDANETNDSKSPQNLHTLIAAVRQDLISWQLRNDAISLIAEQLGLTNYSSETNSTPVKFSVQSFQTTAVDARFCRIVWQNDTVGRLRLTNDGYVDRAIVIGPIGEHGQSDRMLDIERILCTGNGGGKSAVVDLLNRLEQVEKRMNQIFDHRVDVNAENHEMEIDDANA